jgi:hypothetical protein
MVLYGVERDHLGIWGQTKVDVELEWCTWLEVFFVELF